MHQWLNVVVGCASLLAACGDVEATSAETTPESDAGDASGNLVRVYLDPQKPGIDDAGSSKLEETLQAESDAGQTTDKERGDVISETTIIGSDVTLAELRRTVFEPLCAGCHQVSEVGYVGVGQHPWLNVHSENTHDWVGVDFRQPSSCQDMPFVADEPEDSLLYRAFLPDAPCGEHPAMPVWPSEAQVELIGDWIRNSARSECDVGVGCHVVIEQ